MPCKTPQGSIGKGLPAPSRKRQHSPTLSDSRFHLTPSDSADLSSRSASAPRGRAKVRKTGSAQSPVPSSAPAPEQPKKKKKKRSADVSPVPPGGPPSDSFDGQASQLLKLLQSAFQHCGLLPPGLSASADGTANRADQADTGHPTPRGASNDPYESPALEPTQATPVNAQARPPPGVRPREPGHGTHRHSSLSRAPASLGAPPGEETWVGSPSLEAEQAVSEDEFNLDPPGSPAPQPSASTAQDAMEILHRYLLHIYPANELIEASLPASQGRKPVSFGKSFAFTNDDTEAFFTPKTFSPQLDRIGERLGTCFSSSHFASVEKPVLVQPSDLQPSSEPCSVFEHSLPNWK
ncbi:mucin-1-like [Lytechinus variegatus]|uniref:mucin-1-like n=1 Tax=Lytechinus variegatus TaxID=7654 RepID=UPI001BB1E69D|nr:mucin-1-like [Lytechinus variegatus]